MYLSDLNVKAIVRDIREIRDVRVYDFKEDEGTFKIRFKMLEKLPELVAIVDVRHDSAYYDVPKVPRVTPPAHFLVDEVFVKYDLQGIYPSRPSSEID